MATYQVKFCRNCAQIYLNNENRCIFCSSELYVSDLTVGYWKNATEEQKDFYHKQYCKEYYMKQYCGERVDLFDNAILNTSKVEINTKNYYHEYDMAQEVLKAKKMLDEGTMTPQDYEIRKKGLLRL